MTRSSVLKQKRRERKAHRAQKPGELEPTVIYLGGFGKAFRFEVGRTLRAFEVDEEGKVIGEVAEPEPSVLLNLLIGAQPCP